MITEKIIRFLNDDYIRTGRKAARIYIPESEYFLIRDEINSSPWVHYSPTRGIYCIVVQMSYGQVTVTIGN